MPKKHNFHPRDIIHDIKALGGKVHFFDNDFRNYDHKSKKYFSIGGDRIYISKNNAKIIDLKKIKKKLKTIKGKNQLFDLEYKEKIINENINLIRKIKKKLVKKDFLKILVILSMYQFTRPFNLKESHIYQESLRNGKHKSLNKFLRNCIAII